jgi:hypothetical protein
MPSVHPAPGFYAWGADQTFFVSPTGEVWELDPDVAATEVRVPTLPAGAEPFEREMPSMLLRMAVRLGLAPPALQELSDDAVHLLDESVWDGQFSRHPFAEPLAERARANRVGSVEAGHSCGGLAQLDALSRSVIGRPFRG